MIDIHNHILFGIDDGCTNIDESIILLDRMEKMGFSKIILTPHYIDGTALVSDNFDKEYRLKLLKEMLKQKNISIELYLGNEIFITDGIVSLLNDGKVMSINNGRYVLIELPFENEIIGVLDILYELKYNNFIPIIVHPERYTYFQKDISKINKLREEGVLFQINYSSILGLYGRAAMKVVKKLLKNDYVDFFGTDIHNTRKTYVLDNFKKIEKKIIKIIGEDKYKKIVENGELVINNDEIM